MCGDCILRGLGRNGKGPKVLLPKDLCVLRRQVRHEQHFEMNTTFIKRGQYSCLSTVNLPLFVQAVATRQESGIRRET